MAGGLPAEDRSACRPARLRAVDGSLERIAEIVAHTNALKPDLIVLLGDYVTGHRQRDALHSRRRMGAGARPG